jgi:hypothetical protein
MFKITLTGLGLLAAVTISSSQVMATQSFQDSIKNTQTLAPIETDRLMDSRQARAAHRSTHHSQVKRKSGVRSIRQRQMEQIKNQYMLNQMRERENATQRWRDTLMDRSTIYMDR